MHNDIVEILTNDGERGRINVLDLGTASLGPCFSFVSDGTPVGLLPQGLSRSDMFRVMLGLTGGD